MRKLIFQGIAHAPLTEPPPLVDDPEIAAMAQALDAAARRRLGRSLAIREVDAGSCNGCELEIHALNNAFYDLERFGLRFVASPRHADVHVSQPRGSRGKNLLGNDQGGRRGPFIVGLAHSPPHRRGLHARARVELTPRFCDLLAQLVDPFRRPLCRGSAWRISTRSKSTRSLVRVKMAEATWGDIGGV
jgi:hypothetical protein